MLPSPLHSRDSLFATIVALYGYDTMTSFFVPLYTYSAFVSSVVIHTTGIDTNRPFVSPNETSSYGTYNYNPATNREPPSQHKTLVQPLLFFYFCF